MILSAREWTHVELYTEVIFKASFGSGFGCSQFVVALYDLYYLKSLDTYNR